MDLFRKLAAEQQVALVVVTHDDNIIDRLDRIYRLRDGRLVSTTDNASGEVRGRVSGLKLLLG